MEIIREFYFLINHTWAKTKLIMKFTKFLNKYINYFRWKTVALGEKVFPNNFVIILNFD